VETMESVMELRRPQDSSQVLRRSSFCCTTCGWRDDRAVVARRHSSDVGRLEGWAFRFFGFILVLLLVSVLVLLLVSVLILAFGLFHNWTVILFRGSCCCCCCSCNCRWRSPCVEGSVVNEFNDDTSLGYALNSSLS